MTALDGSAAERPMVLALRALGLGDLCTAVPALRALKRSFPRHRLVLAAPTWLAPLAGLAGVDEVVATDPLRPLAESTHGAQLGVNLHGRGPRSTALLAATAPQRLVAFAHHDAPAASASVPWRPAEHEVHRWCRLLSESGIAADPTDLYLGPSGISPPCRVDGAVVVHTGAAAPARRWPGGRWVELVTNLVERGSQVALTGSASEHARCRRIAAAVRCRHGNDAPVVVLAGRTDVLSLLATVERAALVVANDTGVAHLATAIGTRSVVLFGPVPPSEWGPPDSPRHVALWAGRRGDPRAERRDPGLERIEVAHVLAAVDRALAAP